MEFIAIDFEIINNRMDSACSMGIVFVDGNRIVNQKYFLIQPPVLEMDETFTRVHGLTIDNLKDAPTFDKVWEEIAPYFHEEQLVIAHNAHFDMRSSKIALPLTDWNIWISRMFAAFQSAIRP